MKQISLWFHKKTFYLKIMIIEFLELEQFHKKE